MPGEALMRTAEFVSELPSTHALSFDQDALLKYLKQQAKNATERNVVWSWISDSKALQVKKFKFGQSNPTYLINCVPNPGGNRRFVLRRKPPGKLLRGAHMIEREYRVMKALAVKTRVPVPKVYHLCTDAAVIGSAFYMAEFVDGVIYNNPLIPTETLHPSLQRDAFAARFAIYNELVSVLARIHSVNIHMLGLSDFARRREDGGYGNYGQRVVKTWSQQYESSRMKETNSDVVDNLQRRLMDTSEEKDKNVEKIYCLIHGDYRLDNVIFDPKTNRILAVLDWELSTIGHPLYDFASLALPYNLDNPSDLGKKHTLPVFSVKDVSNKQLRRMGVPNELEMFQCYMRNISEDNLLIIKSVFPLKDWNRWIAIRLFVLISIVQGVCKRMSIGNASNPDFGTNQTIKFGLVFMARSAMSTLNRTDIFEALKWDSLVENNADKSVLYQLPNNLEPYRDQLIGDGTEKYFEHRRNLEYFINAVIIPYYKKMAYFYSDRFPTNKWKEFEDLRYIKNFAKSLGLWNLFLPKEYFEKYGLGANLSNVQYATLCELTGKYSMLLPEALNCAAPDTGNMEVLAKYGSEFQRETWLKPLLNGEIRSAYAMTEPLVASSDARNIECRIDKDGDDHYIINGRKWWTSGAMNPKLKLFIVMGHSGDNKSDRLKQSMIVVPSNLKGIIVERHLTVFGEADSWHGGHCEVVFDNVRVPKSYLILGEGRGFEISQGRLGPGRIHHCMRLIGVSEMALEYHLRRVLTRFTFGKRLSQHSKTVDDLSLSRMEIEQCRLLTLQCASMMDKYGNRKARQSISMIKIVAPNVACSVVDRAIQAHGGMGVCQDTPLAAMWIGARALRLADGPDDVHRMLVGRIELRRSKL